MDTDPRYQAALRLLQARGRFGIRLGLGRTRALLRRLGDPHAGLPGVLIGGTNGKGSVQALVAAALIQAGLKVGQTPKPHLASYRERIVVGGTPICATDFADLLDEVTAEADALTRRLGPPTEFELLTCASFLWFRRAGVDVAVVEVGLGGRLDATNAWQGGVSAITNVALDHTEHLGPTVTAIAREKAAIIKRGDGQAVTGAETEALAVISRRARRVGVPLRVVSPLPVERMDVSGVHLLMPDGGRMTVGLLGRHQAANAAVALAILDALAASGIAPVTGQQARSAFAAVQWPGRLEILQLPGGPTVVLDGAHNPHGAAALAAAVDELRPLLPAGRPVLLLGVVRDKDFGRMLGALRSARDLRDALVITTTVPGTDRALPAGELARAWGTGAQPLEDAAAALEMAIAYARAEDGPLVICGSLYLVGDLRTRLVAAGATAMRSKGS